MSFAGIFGYAKLEKEAQSEAARKIAKRIKFIRYDQTTNQAFLINELDASNSKESEASSENEKNKKG